MRVFFYHTENTHYIYSEWQKGTFPGHFLYGMTHLHEHEIDVKAYQHSKKGRRSRLFLNFNTAYQLIKSYRKIDAIYATHYTGIELIVFARALHLHSKPIIIWQHQPIKKSKNLLKRTISSVFYSGIDKLLFFSNKMLCDSIAASNYPREHAQIVAWGADLEFYNHIMSRETTENRHGFISTGKEKRDFRTLIKAFNATNEPLNVYLTRSNLGVNYEKIIDKMGVNCNIKVNFTNGLIAQKLSVKVNQAACVVICCQPTDYTVGLTTVVEALALGLPIVCSRNPQMPMDIEKEGCGITVEYHDVSGWIAAIEHIANNATEAAEMGRRSRALAERVYNDKQCAKEVASVIKSIVGA